MTASSLLGLKPTRLMGAQRKQGGLRTITYNILACHGYPVTPANQQYLERARTQMPTRLALELALYQPDIVSFQESPAKHVVADIARQLGMQHAYFPGGFPGSLLTRFEILKAENCPLAQGERPPDLFTRHWGRAVLRAGTEEITFYSAHLHPTSEDIRAREITEILRVMSKDLARGVPLLFQGDLNSRPEGPEYPRWVKAGLTDAFASKGTGLCRTYGSDEPDKRIDYIWVHGPLAERVRECRVLFEGAFRTNPEDPRSFALSDHIPVMAAFGSGG